MNKTTKVWLTIVCVAMLLVGAVFGTLAYFTDNDSATNTFTIGKVGITLDESDESTADKSDRTTVGNSYHLLPGSSYVKDPTVTVKAGSSEAYVRMIVTVNFAEALTDDQLVASVDDVFVGYDKALWPRANKTVSADKKTVTYEYRYHDTVETADKAEALEPLFTNVVIPEAATYDDLKVFNDMTIAVVAHAVQAEGFANEDAAWVAFGQQNP